MLPDLSNLPEPYKLESGDERFSYFFVTDSGITYLVNFVDQTKYYPNEKFGDSIVYEFQLINTAPETGKYDARIMATVVKSIYDTLLNQHNVILYICESSDEKQAARARLFDNWFRVYSGDIADKIDGKIKSSDNDITEEYVSVIINKQNPHSHNIEKTFNIILNNIDQSKNPNFRI
jgi:hypothetical protein